MAERAIGTLKESGVERISVSAYGTEVDFCEELGFRRRHGIEAMELAVEATPATVTSSGVNSRL